MIKPPYRVPLMSEIERIFWNGYYVVSTFSGCGGSSLGYKMAGYRVLWANEFIPAAQETYKANHPTTVLDKRDIRDVDPSEILAACGLGVGDVDLFDGSPPCASFSMAGIREEGWGKVKKYSDTEQRTDDLFFEYVRLIKGVQPKTFVAENVKGLTVGVAKEVLGDFQVDMFNDQDGTILHSLIDAGYLVRFQVLNAANLGVPQARQRIIFVGVRRDIAKEFELEPTFPRSLPYTYTLRDAIPWIAGESELPVEPESDISRYAVGKEWDKLYIGEQSTKYFQEIKANPDEACPTICASHGSGSIASVVHPFEKRKFSIGELKRVCGFPDDFKLTGAYAQQWERLGRAVPPVMMKYIGHAVHRGILAKIPKGVPRDL